MISSCRGSPSAPRSGCRSRTSPSWSDRGRALRRRRLAAATGAAVACVLAVVGVVVLRDDSPQAVEPVRPPDDAQVQAMEYPGPVMEDLDPGRYAMVPSSDPDFPRARISLPSGWNAWEGPNRFDVQDARGSNEEALEESDLVRRHPGREGRLP